MTTPAKAQFDTSSIHRAPKGYKPWEISNDYPPPKSEASSLPGRPGQLPGGYGDAPWLEIDFKHDSKYYMDIIKEYCLEGMLECDFAAASNKVRTWYHAPWMHYIRWPANREPLRGLTMERPTPLQDLARTQTRVLQTWAIGFFNSAAASVLGGVWADPNEPNWSKDVRFPPGALIFKVLFTDATDEELPTMKGSPEWQAVIAKTPPPGQSLDPAKRNNFPSTVRLLQLDIAVATPHQHSPIGWVFGTYVYDGRCLPEDFIKEPERAKWDRLLQVGLMWGNDPELTQEKFEEGFTSRQQWINPAANELLRQLKGERPSWGWNGRLAGPADNFISSCASCHSVAQKKKDKDSLPTSLVAPTPLQNCKGEWIPENDSTTMRWFRNIKAGKPFDQDAISGDYSLQLMIGFENYVKWRSPKLAEEVPNYVTRPEGILLREGPRINYEQRLV